MKIYLSRFSMLDNSLKINELDWIFPHCLNHSNKNESYFLTKKRVLL